MPHPGPHSSRLQPLACWPHPRPGLASGEGKGHHVATGTDPAFQPCGLACVPPRSGVGTWALARKPGHGGHNGRVPPARTMASFTSSLPAMALRALSTCFTSSWRDSSAQVFPSSARASGAWLLDGGGCGAVSCLLSEHTGDHPGCAGSMEQQAYLSLLCREGGGGLGRWALWFWPPAPRTGIWMTLITPSRHTEGCVAQVGTQEAQGAWPSATPQLPPPRPLCPHS